MDEAQRERPLQVQLNTLAATVEAVTKAVSEITTRLNSVLLSDLAAKCKDEPKRTHTDGSPLAIRMSAVTRELQNSLERLNSILQRLEV